MIRYDMIRYDTMQGSKARSLSCLQNQGIPVHFDDCPTTSGKPDLTFGKCPDWRETCFEHHYFQTQALPSGSPIVHSLSPAKPPPCKRPPTHQGGEAPRPPPRSPPQHWGAESAPPGAPCQCRGSCAQGKYSPFWGPPPLTIRWL